MSGQDQIPANDRAEMIRAHIGLMTAVLAGDDAARGAMIGEIIRSEGQPSGDTATLVARLGKQIEAGAQVSVMLMKMVADDRGRTYEDAVQELGQKALELELPD